MPTSVLRQGWTRAVQATQIFADPKIHPADPLNSFVAFPGSAAREITVQEATQSDLEHRERIWSEDITMMPIQPKEQRPIPTLEHGLDRVLFKYFPS